jgi:hypothetical protein
MGAGLLGLGMLPGVLALLVVLGGAIAWLAHDGSHDAERNLPLVAGRRAGGREPMPYAEFQALAERWQAVFSEAHREARRQGLSMAQADKYARARSGPVPSLYS